MNKLSSEQFYNYYKIYIASEYEDEHINFFRKKYNKLILIEKLDIL